MLRKLVKITIFTKLAVITCFNENIEFEAVWFCESIPEFGIRKSLYDLNPQLNYSYSRYISF